MSATRVERDPLGELPSDCVRLEQESPMHLPDHAVFSADKMAKVDCFRSERPARGTELL